MAVVSYRLYCDSCDNEAVVRGDEMDESLWQVNSKTQHSGLCPECNPSVSVDDMQEARESREDDDEAVEFEQVDGVGKSVADALRRDGVRTRGDVRLASDTKLLEVKGVGQSKVDSIRAYVAELADGA